MSNILFGLEKFTEYFKNFPDNYIIVGGTASNVFLDEAALEMRITKDIDIIIIVETLTKEFGKRFWEFIRDGQYDLYKSKDEKLHYYRLINNNTNEYPKMIELFSMKQGFIHEVDSLFTPIIIDDEISSLSAII